MDAQIALYRSLLADKRVLIVLDNAADADQVRPLLPAESRCATVVISRRPSYHGVTYGGLSATGLPPNQEHFGAMLTGREPFSQPSQRAARTKSLGLSAWRTYFCGP